MELIYRDLAIFMAEQIEDYKLRVKVVLSKIGRNRSNLQREDYELYQEMSNAAEEYCEENGIDFNEIDLEELLWC